MSIDEISRRMLLKASATGVAGLLRGAEDLPPLRPGPRAPETEGSQAFERVTLEVSLKPFRGMEEGAIRAVCERIFRDWAPLLRHAGGTAVMLWTADGSEILDYRGRLDGEIEWARYIGIANPPEKPSADDPERKGLHARPWLYMEDPPRLTYGRLRNVVRALKSTGRAMTGKPVTVGATFDPGPEFARSPFKYERHPEISGGTTMGRGTWVTCNAVLKADSVSYAGFPDGIPEGTSLGAFLGRQAQHFLADLGFDYIWFSNGFGFALESWSVKGVLFDGTRFDAAPARGVREQILGFWKDFRRECPRFPVETRGSNLSVGADLSAHASPVKDIYEGGFNMTAPPNSPWAAINGDFGIEVVGYLSRIAHLPPGGKFPFRFYTHDPWWLNSPWFDRYGREPHDIYLPLALARLDGAGRVTRPAYLEFLTIDNSFGEMPDRCPIEVTPHLLTAMDHYSDAPGPVTWIYPFTESHQAVFGASPRLAEVFFGDWFLRGAVNSGFPLNTVVSTEHFLESRAAVARLYADSVLLVPVPAAGSGLERALLEAMAGGQRVLFYGPAARASRELLDLLGLKITAPVGGELEVRSALGGDVLRRGEPARRIEHRELLSGGGIDTVSSDAAITVARGGEERAYAVVRGNAGWIRGSVCCSIASGHLPVPDDPRRWFGAEVLLRHMLARLGYSIRVEKPEVATRDPLVLAARSRNGYYFSGYSPSTTATVRLRFPHGAPLLTGTETWVEDGHSAYTMPRAWHREARCFIEQAESGEVSCVERHSGHMGIRRRLALGGLRNATVHFYREPGDGKVIISNDQRLHNADSLAYQVEDGGRRLVAHKVSGELLISW